MPVIDVDVDVVVEDAVNYNGIDMVIDYEIGYGCERSGFAV